MQIINKNAIAISLGCSLLAATSLVHAHGESIRGGGAGSVNAVGAGITEEVVVGVRWDARRYETFSDQKLANFKREGEDVHMHSSEDAYFLTIGLPVTEDIDLAIMTQYNRCQGFKDNGDDFANACFAAAAPAFPTSCISETDDSKGWGDTLLMGRYRFYNDGESQWAGVLGVIVPTGKTTNKTDNGEILGTHNQPGSGAFTVQGGLAFSGHLSDKMAIDADAIYRVNGQGAKSFRSGNSLQLDAAVSYNHHARVVPVLELNAIFFKKDIENDDTKKNSGGDVVYISPGINWKLTKKIGVYGNFSYPIYQELGGISNDENYRWSLGASYAFGDWSERGIE